MPTPPPTAERQRASEEWTRATPEEKAKARAKPYTWQPTALRGVDTTSTSAPRASTPRPPPAKAKGPAEVQASAKGSALQSKAFPVRQPWTRLTLPPPPAESAKAKSRQGTPPPKTGSRPGTPRGSVAAQVPEAPTRAELDATLDAYVAEAAAGVQAPAPIAAEDNPPPMSLECVVDDQRAATGKDITVGNQAVNIIARYIRRYISQKDNPASQMSRRLWAVWANGFASQYNFLQALTGLPGHELGGESDGHDLIRFLSQNSKLVPDPAVVQATATVKTEAEEQSSAAAGSSAGVQAPAEDSRIAVLPSDLVSLMGSQLSRVKDPQAVLEADPDEWRIPQDFRITDQAIGDRDGPFVNVHYGDREKMREAERMCEGILWVPFEVAEALTPTVERVGVFSDSTLCLTFGEGAPGQKAQNPIAEIAALEAAAGRELAYYKLLPGKGLDHIVAHMAMWRLQLAGVEPEEIPFLGNKSIDLLVNMAVEAHIRSPASSDGVVCVIVWSNNDTTTADAAKKERAPREGGVLKKITGDLHASLFWLSRLRDLFTGVVVLGCGSGELWEIENAERFNQQVQIVKHLLYARHIPMIDCPRYWTLKKHDEWHFDGSPATKHALATFVHTTVNLLSMGMLPRTAWLLGQYSVHRSELATNEKLADYLDAKRCFCSSRVTFCLGIKVPLSR